MDAGITIGKGIAFPPHVGPDGRVAWSTGSDNVSQCMQVVLLTQTGERIMLADFGSRLPSFLYEPNTPATRRLVQQAIEQSLQKWEPRIQLDSVVVDVDSSDARTAVATVYYKLVATGTTGQVTVKVNLAQ